MDTIARWHAVMESRDPALLADLIAEDCVFRSPAVHSAQAGRTITVKYLTAAMAVLGGADFRYTGEWRAENSAVLEFETMVDGMAVNGVDIIHWDSDGRITSFKVMARPIRGLQALIPAMAARLDTAGAG